MAQPLFGAPQREIELREVPTTHVAQLTALQIRPDAFDRVEIRRVAWELLQMDPLGGPTGQAILDRLTTVNGCPIPDDEELAGDLTQEAPQEANYFGAVGGSRLGLQEEAAVTAQRPDDPRVSGTRSTGVCRQRAQVRT
jgi:hypothetical protein